ncbi:hypothetical protein JOL79_25190 [Microbispora sp. RL4-1S]|uniref:DUF4276 family protein n=1 Tax=Microbispora oryzae TaxID=2806554 RepID=A0A940WTD8_9ACTN|nr:hypothetical protein [Microbispora oryzae]MBP2707085.1 hypothetical protein [Microbispora oryzae]
MTLRVLFLAEGTSDSGLIRQIERIAVEAHVDIAVTHPDLARLPKPPGPGVAAKLRAVLEIDGSYDLLLIHRDADRDGRDARIAEIFDAVDRNAPGTPHTAIIPVRMTEAWLLVDEAEIRVVAGNPNGKVKIDLPAVSRVESIPDPKSLLKEKLALASGLTGRKLQKFNQRFPQNRRLLLERIDPDGPIAKVPSWCAFVTDLKAGLWHATGSQDRAR